MTEPVVSLERVGVTFTAGPVWNRRRVDAVRDVSLSIRAGETLGFVG